MNSTFIYTLSDPITNGVRYVGKANNPERRFLEHIHSCCIEKTYKSNWILGLKNKGLSPILGILQKVSKEEWEVAEKRWIRFFLDRGNKLTNLTDGGDGCLLMSKEEERKRIEAIRKTKAQKFPITMKQCLLCGGKFRVCYSEADSLRKFCSRNCYSKSKKGKKPPNYLGEMERNCISCNKLFSTPPYSGRKFCSSICYYISLQGRSLSKETRVKQSIGIKNSWEGRRKFKIKNQCLICEVVFECYTIESRKFCSHKCYWIFLRSNKKGTDSEQIRLGGQLQ